MAIATGGESSSTGMLATISAVRWETLTVSGRSSSSSWVWIQVETPVRASSMIDGVIYKVTVSIRKITKTREKRAYVFLCPGLDRAFDPLFAINPPILSE